MAAAQTPAVPAGAAVYIALVQFLFVTTWTIYVIFLPRLLDSAGIPAAWTAWILLLDQLVFLVMDVATGVAADRVQRRLGRLGPMIVSLTLLSCLAFLLLPFAVRLGGLAPVVSLALMLVWTATSSALRAPPWVLLGKYAARPKLPWLNSLTLVGLAAGGALAPYLGAALKNSDPRWPFALSSLTLLAVTAGLVRVERQLAARPAAPPVPAAPPPVLGAGQGLYLVGILLLAAGFQIHFSLNAAAQFLRFARPSELEGLLPIFWLGFAVAMMPGSALCKRFGPLAVMVVAALMGAVAAFASAQAATLGGLIPAQLIAGSAWGNMLMAVFCSSADRGRIGREGLALGSMFAMLALATLGRIALGLAGVARDPAYADALARAPVLLWLLGGLSIWALSQRTGAAREPTAALPSREET